MTMIQYKLDPTPEPSDEEEESSDDEDDGFGSSKKKEEDLDPAASKNSHVFSSGFIRIDFPESGARRHKIMPRWDQI